MSNFLALALGAGCFAVTEALLRLLWAARRENIKRLAEPDQPRRWAVLILGQNFATGRLDYGLHVIYSPTKEKAEAWAIVSANTKWGVSVMDTIILPADEEEE